MYLALDAMGGDDAPLAMVQGAIDYARAFPTHQVILVGREHDIRACLKREGANPVNVIVEDAPEVIGMGEKINALKELWQRESLYNFFIIEVLPYFKARFNLGAHNS
jgi:fatty acid/phospholipid biosynthesis enzyme